MHSEFIVSALYKGGRVHARASFYSGRGARAGDLPPETLEAVHAAIVKNISVEAAQQFAQMVADIPVLSATDFLIQLAQLEGAGWKWDPARTVQVRGNYADSMETAFATVAEGLSQFGQPREDDTIRIRGAFLKAHIEELRDDQQIQAKAESADPYGYGRHFEGVLLRHGDRFHEFGRRKS